MSIKIMSMVWDSGVLDGSELLAMLALADYANDEGYCYPGYAAIAKKIRVSERQAMRIVKALVDDCFLAIAQPGDGRGINNLFRIDTSKLEEKKGDIQGKKGDIQGKKGDIQGNKRVTSRVKKGDIQGKHSIYITNIQPPIQPEDCGGGFSSTEENSKQPEQPATETDTATATATAATQPATTAAGWEAVQTAYESEIGLFTAMTSELIHDAVDEYGAIMVVDAIKAASTQNVRKWAYVDGILKRWKANGRPSAAKPVPVAPKIMDARRRKDLPDYMKQGLGLKVA